MYWIIIIAAMVILAAVASLIGTWHTRRDLAGGRPSYLSLADHTGIWDRGELAALCGLPDQDDRYSVSVETAATLPKSKWHRHFDSPFLDLACALAAAASIWLESNNIAGALWFLTLCGLYQLVSWSVATWQVVRNASWSE